MQKEQYTIVAATWYHTLTSSPPFLCQVPVGNCLLAKPIDSRHVEQNLAINVTGLDLSLLGQLLDLNWMESVPICFWPLWLYIVRWDGARKQGKERDGKKVHNCGEIWKAVQDIHQVTNLRIIPNFYSPVKCEKCVKSLWEVFIFLTLIHFFVPCISSEIISERAQG